MLIAGRAFGRSGACGRLRESCPSSRSSASAAENHSAHLIAQPLNLLWIGCVPEPLSKVEEFLLLLFFCLDPVLDELHQHPVGAETPGSRHGTDLCRDIGWEADTLSNNLVCGSHNTIMHHIGAVQEKALVQVRAP